MRDAWCVVRDARACVCVCMERWVIKKRRERGNNKKLNLRLRVDPYGEIQWPHSWFLLHTDLTVGKCSWLPIAIISLSRITSCSRIIISLSRIKACSRIITWVFRNKILDKRNLKIETRNSTLDSQHFRESRTEFRVEIVIYLWESIYLALNEQAWPTTCDLWWAVLDYSICRRDCRLKGVLR